MKCVCTNLSSARGRRAVCVSGHSGSAQRGSKNAARITGEMIEKKIRRVQVELERVPNVPAVILVLGTWLAWADERGGGRRHRETLVFSLPLTNQIGEWC